MLKRVATFIGVGAFATLVHMLVGGFLIWMMLSPLVANTAGFLVSLLISFQGHRRATFRDVADTGSKSFTRFFGFSVAVFLANQTLLITLITMFHLSALFGLCIATGSMAIASFFAMQRWVFGK